MTALPTLRLRTAVNFPATVTGDGGIGVTKDGADWTIAPDFSGLAEETTLTNTSSSFTQLYDATQDIFYKVSMNVLISAVTQSGGGISFSSQVGNSTSDADPGNGILNFNDSTQSDATVLYVDLLDSTGTDLTAILDSMDDSTNTIKGQISIVKIGDPTKRWIGNISAVTSATGYRKLTVANLLTSPTTIPFVSGDAVQVSFVRAGDESAGDVTAGSTFATDNVIVRSDGTLKGVQKTGISVDDSDNLLTPGKITTAIDDSTNAGVTRPVVARHTTSGTATAGIGTGIQFEVETATGNNVEVAAVIDVVSTDVTSTSEDFDFVFKLMAAGAAVSEMFRVASTGVMTVLGDATKKVLTAVGGLNLTGGFSTSSFSAGTKTTGTFTPDPLSGNIQHYTNGGAHTLAPPTNPCTMVIQCLNNSSAGTITKSGFTLVNGDTLNTTSGKAFELVIRKTNDYSLMTVTAIN